MRLPSCPPGTRAEQWSRRHKEEVESLLAGHLEELLPGRPEEARAVAEQLAFLLEGAMARAGLEGAATRLEHARTMAAAPGGQAVMRPAGRAAGSVRVGSLCVLLASVLWGTTGTAATFAPSVGPLAIGAVAMGLGGLLQALMAAARIAREVSGLRAQRGVVLLGAMAVAVYPLAFYSSMHLAGVAAGTVVSIGSAPLASALIERVVDGRRLTRRWMLGAALGLSGTVLLCVAEAAEAHSDFWGRVRADDRAGRGARPGGRAHLRPLFLGGTPADQPWCLLRRGDGKRLRAGRCAASCLCSLATGAPLLASWPNAAVGAYMALVPMFIGYVLFGWGLAHVPASTATTLSLLEPAVAAVLAVLVVGERLPPLGWGGIALVVGCLAVLTTPQRRAPRPQVITPPLKTGSEGQAASQPPGVAIGDSAPTALTEPEQVSAS